MTNKTKKAKIVSHCKGLIDQRKDSEMSIGEQKVAKYLEALNIHFIREWYKGDLVNPKTNSLLFMDFYLPTLRIAIEVDGRHHFKAIDGDREKLEDQKKRDAIKNKYCKGNGIIMVRLQYKDIKDVIPKLDIALDEKRRHLPVLKKNQPNVPKPKKKWAKLEMPKVEKTPAQIEASRQKREEKVKGPLWRIAAKIRLKEQDKLHNEQVESKRNQARMSYSQLIKKHSPKGS